MDGVIGYLGKENFFLFEKAVPSWSKERSSSGPLLFDFAPDKVDCEAAFEEESGADAVVGSEIDSVTCLVLLLTFRICGRWCG